MYHYHINLKESKLKCKFLFSCWADPNEGGGGVFWHPPKTLGYPPDTENWYLASYRNKLFWPWKVKFYILTFKRKKVSTVCKKKSNARGMSKYNNKGFCKMLSTRSRKQRRIENCGSFWIYTGVFEGMSVLDFTSQTYPKRAKNFLYSTYQKMPFSMSPAVQVQQSHFSIKNLP